MAEKQAATAAALRLRRIPVPVPDSDLVIYCRRPDPLDLIARNLLPLELFHTVLDRINESDGNVAADMMKQPKPWGDFIDRWVCAAAIEPIVVMTPEEASDTALWVEDLEPVTRLLIWSKTNDRLVSRRVSEALTAFRDQQPLLAGARSGGAAVREDAVGVAARD